MFNLSFQVSLFFIERSECKRAWWLVVRWRHCSLLGWGIRPPCSFLLWPSPGDISPPCWCRGLPDRAVTFLSRSPTVTPRFRSWDLWRLDAAANVTHHDPQTLRAPREWNDGRPRTVWGRSPGNWRLSSALLEIVFCLFVCLFKSYPNRTIGLARESLEEFLPPM